MTAPPRPGAAALALRLACLLASIALLCRIEPADGFSVPSVTSVRPSPAVGQGRPRRSLAAAANPARRHLSTTTHATSGDGYERESELSPSESPSAEIRPNDNDYSSAEESLPTTPPVKVGIVGAGAVAFGTAALLVRNGHDPMLWSPSGEGTSDLSAASTDGARKAEGDAPAPTLTSTGAIESTFAPRIAKSAEHLVNSNAVILLALPANGHLSVMDALVPHIRPDQILVISSHSSLGAVYLTQRLADERDIAVPIVAWGTTAVTARKTSGRSVAVCTVRSLVDLCTVPDQKSSVGLRTCQSLFGTDVTFKVRDGLLAISLSNLNAQNHLGIVLGNMSRMERGEVWSQGLNITPNVGRLLEALDAERLDIAAALGLDGLRTVYQHFALSFHVPVSSVSEMNADMVRRGIDVDGPDDPNSRYVTEDVPYGLTLIIVLGKLVGRPAVLHEAGIRIVSAMYGRDFGMENDLLNALGDLTELGVEELREAGRTGRLSKNKPERRRRRVGERRRGEESVR